MTEIDPFDIRETVNGIWLFLNIALSFVFWRHIVLKARSRGWYHDAGVQAAVALAVYFTGSTIMRAWVWSLLLLERRGDDHAFLSERVEVPLMAAGFAVVGALCCIRVFSPGPWGNWFWISTGVLAILIPMAVHYFV